MIYGRCNMTKTQSEAVSRLPVFCKLYHDYYNLIGRCFRMEQDYNCHTFIQKKNLITKKYFGGFSDYPHK